MHKLVCLLLVLASCGKGSGGNSQAEAAPSPKAPAGSNAPQPAAGTPPVKAASRGPEHAVYSLIDNRLSAHLTRGGGLVVPAGSAAFAKYTRFGNQMRESATRSWELRQDEAGIKVARMTGRIASVFVPLTAAQARSQTVRLRLHGKKGTLSVRVNEDQDKETHKEIGSGWQTVEIKATNLVEGENQISLYAKSSDTALAWVQIGGTPIGDDGATSFYDSAKQALAIPSGGQMSWYVMVPDKARLTGDLDDGACTLAVRATGEDGTAVEGKLVGLGSAVELGKLAGKAARLELEAQGCPTARLANANLVIPGDAPAAIQRGAAPKYVLFIVMDSLRADRVKIFNPKAKADAPNFEKLAQTSAVFLQHFSPGTESQVSHASMWTSQTLAKHKASEMKHKLPEKLVTIDDVAKAAKLRTFGVTANGYIRPTRGFGTTWEKFANHITEGGGLRGANVIDKGLGWLEAKKADPWFLYLGLIDTHVTWRAKSPWIEKYDGGYKGRFATAFGDEGPDGPPKDLTEREIEHVRALYDSNVSYQDDQLGKLIEKLQAWGVWDQTMLIITADHGDELWEDGKTFGHAKSTRQTVIHIPLLVHYPPLVPAGKIESGTEGIDIVPTIADALGIQPDASWQGTSLLPLAHGRVIYPQLAIASHYEDVHAGRLGHWKLKLIGAKTPMLHDLAKDGGEKHDQWGKAHIPARMLLDAMWTFRAWNTEWKKSVWGNPAAVTSKFAADLGE